jgi:hypothetical protein
MFLEAFDGVFRPRKRRFGGVEQPRDFLEVVFGHLDQRGQELEEPRQVLARFEPQLFQTAEASRYGIAVFVDLPFQADRLLRTTFTP